jgi:hypothetical protein
MRLSAFHPEPVVKVKSTASLQWRSRAGRLRAMCGRLRVGKKNLHVAGLVGAAMCSACLRGTRDRWP